MRTLRIFAQVVCCFCFAVATILFLIKETGDAVAMLLIALLVFFVTRTRGKEHAGHVDPGRLTEVVDDELRLTLEKWIVLDVETTGLDPKNDRIIEIAAKKYINGYAVDSFEHLVNPDRPLPHKITELTGIRSVDLLRAPRFRAIAPDLASFLGDNIIVAHNAKFDAEFVANELARAGIMLDISYIDTVRMARWCFPGMGNYKLNTLIAALGLLDHEQDHRAMSDVDVTEKLYCICRERIPETRMAEEQERQREKMDDKAFHLNQYGMQAESDGNTDKAIMYYEDIVSDGAVLPNAYMRLAVIYKKQHRWKDVVRVCESALAVLPGHPGKLCQPEEYQRRRAYALSKLEAESGELNP